MIDTILTRDFGTPAKEINLATEMITLTIDGVQVTVPAGTSLMRAAAENGNANAL